MGTFNGTPAGDVFNGSADDDTAFGLGGDDRLIGNGGADLLDGGDGSDYLFSYNVHPYVADYGYSLSWTRDVGIEVDRLSGGGGNDYIAAGYGDVVSGGDGYDVLYLTLLGAPNGLTIDFSASSPTAEMLIGAGSIVGIESVLQLVGTNFDDVIVGSFDGIDTSSGILDGSGGNDVLSGAAYLLSGGDGDDTIDGHDAVTADGGAGNDRIVMGEWGFAYGRAGNDDITASSEGAWGGAGDDILRGQDSGGDGEGILSGEADNDVLIGGSRASRLYGGTGADILAGNDGNDILIADQQGSQDDPLDRPDAGTERDILNGGNGNDVISAGYGDSVDGGAHSDRLRLSMLGASAGVTIDLQTVLGGGVIAGGGTIKSIEFVTHFWGSGFNDYIALAAQKLEGKVDAGGGDDIVRASSTRQIIALGAGDDRIISGGAADSINGGDGSDTIDYSSMTAAISIDLDKYIAPFGAALISIENIVGTAFADTLRGNGANNILDGGAGADFMAGAAGDDLYTVDDANDQVAELGNQGYDIIRSSVSYSIDPTSYVEELVLVGAADIDARGNGLNNVLRGNEGRNALDSGGGSDLIFAEGGDDIVNLGVGAAVVHAGAGNDLIQFYAAAVTYPPPAEIGLLDGGEGYDVLNLASVSPVTFGLIQRLDGAYVTGVYVGSQRFEVTGIEQLRFGAADNYIDVSGARDPGLTVFAGDGNDRISASPNVTIYAEGGDDLVMISGVFGSTATGLVNGGGGIDTLQTNIATTVDLGNGTAVSGGATWQIGGFERLVLTVTSGYASTAIGSAADDVIGVSALHDDASAGITVSGNDGDDMVTGSRAADVLRGDAGNDTLNGMDGGDRLEGGVGNDKLDGGAGDDRVLGGDGNDTVVGGDGRDVLYGDAGNDVIEGGAGTDFLYGGAGTDSLSYESATAAVVVSLSLTGAQNTRGAGVDTVTGFENIRGSGFDDRLTGDDGRNIINGLDGADVMIGLGGDDSYYVDNAGDKVVEKAGGGYDSVTASVDYKLGAEIEALTLTGRSHIDATGNALDNVLTGNSGNNRLNGGAGADRMVGKGGDDIYYVDNVGDVIVEQAGEGRDLVVTSVAFDLRGKNVEDVRMVGSANIDASGDAGANDMRGNSGNNILRGDGGNDVLTGGAGRDIFVFDTAPGAGNVDRITDFVAGTDRVAINPLIFTAIGPPGTLAAGAFQTGAMATEADDRILYDGASGNIYYDADGNGAGAAVLFAQVTAGTALSNADFVVIG